jgi:hypothetical protein
MQTLSVLLLQLGGSSPIDVIWPFVLLLIVGLALVYGFRLAKRNHEFAKASRTLLVVCGFASAGIVVGALLLRGGAIQYTDPQAAVYIALAFGLGAGVVGVFWLAIAGRK